MHIFIDTNIYLKFYHYSNDELEELKKLIILVEEGEISLYIPKQVVDEFKRNRETKIADALKTFREDKLHNNFPIFFKEYPEFESLKKAIRDYNSNRKILLDKVTEEIENHSLKADEIIEDLFSKAEIIDADEELTLTAKNRFDLGNPPGKNNSYGDALNWETLLKVVDFGNDLYFISDDKDYFSEINNARFNNFLEQEWKSKKLSNLYFFKTLSDFFKAKYPTIKLASDIHKDMFIEKLELASSFRDARYFLHRLSDCEDFSSEQINRILQIALENTQLYWIVNDDDINGVLFQLIDKYKSIIDEQILESFLSKIVRKVIA